MKTVCHLRTQPAPSTSHPPAHPQSLLEFETLWQVESSHEIVKWKIHLSRLYSMPLEGLVCEITSFLTVTTFHLNLHGSFSGCFLINRKTCPHPKPSVYKTLKTIFLRFQISCVCYTCVHVYVEVRGSSLRSFFKSNQYTRVFQLGLLASEPQGFSCSCLFSAGTTSLCLKV